MATLEQVVEQREQRMIERCAATIATDIAAILDNGEQFGSPSPAVGEGLVPVTPLSPARLRVKRAHGWPDTPRVKTGDMRDSIGAEAGNLIAVVDVQSDPDKATAQNDGSTEPWTDEDGVVVNIDGSEPTPARPFWGISDRALKACDQVVAEEGEKMVRELDAVTLPTLRISM